MVLFTRGGSVPRGSREKSITQVYHLMQRGINGQIIFIDDEDYSKFLSTIKEYKNMCGYEIYAFCIMNNHVHLLIKEGKEELGLVMRRVGAKYVYWYNNKYKRTGHLFQDRYKSEPVNDESYLMTVLRYIHMNPTKAGIVHNIFQYNWSSYNDYIGIADVCDTQFILKLFNDDKKTAIRLFKKFHNEENNDNCLEYIQNFRIDDMEAITIINTAARIKTPKQIQALGTQKRNEIIKKIKSQGLSIRQIERLTGVSFGVIRRI
jgi:REP element-mobilizing transposase RayT